VKEWREPRCGLNSRLPLESPAYACGTVRSCSTAKLVVMLTVLPFPLQKKELARILGLAGGLPVKSKLLRPPTPSPKTVPPKLLLAPSHPPPPVSKAEQKSLNTMPKRPKVPETKRTDEASGYIEERPDTLSERPILPGRGSLSGETGPEAPRLDELGSCFSDGDLAPRNTDQKEEMEERGTGQGLSLKKKRDAGKTLLAFAS
jgi:hypothetical protein